jgi:hypothetical protein
MQRQIGSIGTLDGEIFDQRRLVLHNLGISRYEEVHNDINRVAPVRGRNLTDELKPAKVPSLTIIMLHQRFDQARILAIAQSFGIETQVHVESADVRHLFVVQKQPRDSAADDRKLALKAAENLADFQQDRFHRSRRAVIVVIRGLGLRSQLCRPNLVRRKCSAASAPRSPLTERSR